METERRLLRHFLAAIAYRTQKALRDAPTDFGEFRAAPKVRTPHELVRHMDSVLGYSRTFFIGGPFSDAMTHAGQLALLRRLAGSPIASENFVFARVSAEHLGPVQPLPVAPDKDWMP